MTFEEWLATKPTSLSSIAKKWWLQLQRCGPDVIPIIHDGHPVVCYDEAPFAYVNAFTHHVNIGFFYGVDLEDPSRLLEGSGKRMRHVKIKPPQATPEEALKALIDAAYVDIRVRITS